MAITTRLTHVHRAVDFFNKPDLYFAIGRTTPWTYEMAPPEEVDTTTSIDEVIGYRKIDRKYLVVPDEAGEIVYRNQKFRAIDPSQAVAEGSKWVYLETTILYDELPTGFYRQVGLYQGLRRKASIDQGRYALLPTEVEVPGDLVAFANRQMSNRQGDQKEKITLVIEF